MDIKTSIESINIAKDLDKQELLKIANQVVDGYDTDKDSRKPWETDLKKWTELALQVSTPKTFPWKCRKYQVSTFSNCCYAVRS